MEYLFGQITREYWNEVKQIAEDRGIGFLISPQDAWKVFLQQNRRCEFTNCELDFTSLGYRGTASLDRIDADKSYVRGNVQWVLADINVMRGRHNARYFRHLCCLVATKKERTAFI